MLEGFYASFLSITAAGRKVGVIIAYRYGDFRASYKYHNTVSQRCICDLNDACRG